MARRDSRPQKHSFPAQRRAKSYKGPLRLLAQPATGQGKAIMMARRCLHAGLTHANNRRVSSSRGKPTIPLPFVRGIDQGFPVLKQRDAQPTLTLGEIEYDAQ
jgi:hypothetical protein